MLPPGELSSSIGVESSNLPYMGKRRDSLAVRAYYMHLLPRAWGPWSVERRAGHTPVDFKESQVNPRAGGGNEALGAQAHTARIDEAHA